MCKNTLLYIHLIEIIQIKKKIMQIFTFLKQELNMLSHFPSMQWDMGHLCGCIVCGHIVLRYTTLTENMR